MKTNFVALLLGLALAIICAPSADAWRLPLFIYGLILFCTAMVLILCEFDPEIDALRDYFRRGEK